MAYDGKLLARARTKLDNIRAHMAEIIRMTISRSADIGERIELLREENLDLQMRRAELLTEYGFGTDYLEEIISCDKCRDTGIHNGGV